jgi:hypothetical protein
VSHRYPNLGQEHIFQKFPNLPAELRVKIWEYTWPEARLIQPAWYEVGSNTDDYYASTILRPAVEGYLRHDNYKFLKETQEVPSFSIDLLKSVKATLNTLSVGYSGKSAFCKDPLSGEKVWLIQ